MCRRVTAPLCAPKWCLCSHPKGISLIWEEKWRDFSFPAPALVGELPGGCVGFWGWVAGEPPAPLCLRPQRRSGRLRDVWGLVLGTGEGLWGLWRSRAQGEDPWLQRVPEFVWGPFRFLQASPFAGDQSGLGFRGDNVDKELAPRLSEPGRADGLCRHRRVQ